MKPLVCVRHQPSVPLGIIRDVLDAGAVEWRYLDAWRESPDIDVAGTSGLIVLGGGMNADQLDDFPFLSGVRDVVGRAVEAEVPVLGICLGAQVLARAAGALVHASPVREVGFYPVQATEAGAHDPVLAPFAPEAHVFQFHEDACELPAGAELLFTSEPVPVQAFRVGKSAYGVQFHFEVTALEIDAWCDETPDLEDAWGTTKQEVLDEATLNLDAQRSAGRALARAWLELLGTPE